MFQTGFWAVLTSIPMGWKWPFQMFCWIFIIFYWKQKKLGRVHNYYFVSRTKLYENTITIVFTSNLFFSAPEHILQLIDVNYIHRSSCFFNSLWMKVGFSWNLWDQCFQYFDEQIFHSFVIVNKRKFCDNFAFTANRFLLTFLVKIQFYTFLGNWIAFCENFPLK
jgi:hypothetical protein